MGNIDLLYTRRNTYRIFISYLAFVYVAANIGNVAATLVRGRIGGDFEDYAISMHYFAQVAFVEIALCIAFLIMSYAILRVSVGKRQDRRLTPSSSVGLAIAILQILYLTFCYIYKFSFAGVYDDVNTPIKYIFIIIQVDFLVVIYLSATNRGKLGIFNAVLYMASSILRGWIVTAAMFLFALAAMKYLRSRKIGVTKVAIAGAAIVFLLPVILYVKDISRVTQGDLATAIELGAESNENQNYSEASIAALQKFTQRFSHVTEVAVFMENIESIKKKYAENKIAPFYADGILQYYIWKQFNDGPTMNRWFTKYAKGLDYNIHIGILPWLMLTPVSLLIYVPYILLLQYIALYLLARCTSYYRELTYLGAVIYLMHGWFGAFSAYIFAAMIYAFLNKLLGAQLQTRLS